MRKPEFFSMIRKKEITKEQFFRDFRAGVGVAIISLPLSIALGISSGVTPQEGLITAVVAGLITALLGGSPVQIGGPTGAFVVVVFGIVQKYGIEGLIISTFMGGIILILLGVLRLGSLIKFIPYPITVGFTAGVAAILATTEIKDFFGLHMGKVTGGFFSKWIAYITHMNTMNYVTVLVGVGSILIIVFWPRVNKSIPGSLVALIAATIIVKLLGLHVETIGSTFGNIPASIPMPKIPTMNLELIKELIGPAITIALLSAISSLLSAVVSDETLGQKHNSNTELIAQGVSNIVSALFGGIPSAGVVARTTANIRGGGRTPIAGIVNAVLLLIIMLVLMPLAKFIPLTTLGAILLVVAYKMTKWKTMYAISKGPKSDLLLLAVTFILTVVFNVVVAVEVGMAIAALGFMIKMSDTLEIEELEKENIELDRAINMDLVGGRIRIKELKGALFFGTASVFKDSMRRIEYENVDVLIFRMRNINDLDITAIKMLDSLNVACELYKVKFILTGLNQSNAKVIEKLKGEDITMFANIEEGIEEANRILNLKG
ncbi:SulP family inorganic anion transporter [uncultured Clostridium sp.]|jgi:SulP family sulfate permease|uniref:SulP family inorganic anion transporter n=1 Tax=uncultured Clostridium sp. TaxID=59620 RepID=UPI002618DA33|nr:SulP family inorganic anion transporter [uncultured Clostridium sp.]